MRADAQLHAFGLEQENVEHVQVADAGAVAVVRIGSGADGERDAQQLRDAYDVIGCHRKGAAQQRIIGVSVGIEQLGCVVILQVYTGCQVQRVVAFVGGLGVIRVSTKSRCE
ncbi:hypothetical protein D3C72_1486030 [compost metagenome]